MGFLFSLLAGIPGLIGKYFDAKAQVQIATINAQAAMASDASALATAQLQATSQRFKEWMIFILFIPMFCSIVAPNWAYDIFTGMQKMPEWYLQECVTVYNTILGIAVSTNFISKIVDKISIFSSIKHAAAIEVAKFK